MNDLERLLHLRKMREARAARAAAQARNQYDAAAALRDNAARQLNGYEHDEAQREAHLHAALLEHRFSGDDLRAAADRALHSAAAREELTATLTAAEAAVSVAEQASLKASQEWRQSLRRREKLQVLFDDIFHRCRLRQESLTEAEAEDTPRIAGRSGP
ncbi:hypothetical protein [Paracoccus onubensis]|uniref:Type III secretion protein n=1 Tax=Paracoccus onubensis TaxID=1675788 RepID=A0A418T8G0_9RHOB|nr:hypothetical protein [Paracoccus onubensis]RJE89482.1 hypothetical protein D3P04_02325 [Paracoccus onubensis]